ncbi:MAG: DUF4258 domain-containing protein [Gammaproteobacteria bacterium]|nr:DUF4258 domain-containing protein [Gammaproteobacteria bacterium]
MAREGAKLQESRASHIGGNNAKLEELAYNPLGRLTKAETKLGGVSKRSLSYAYDAGGNGRNLPERITVGGSRTDETPTSRDEFAHGPDGARYRRKTSYMDGETLRTENTYYLGAFEELLPHSGAEATGFRGSKGLELENAPYQTRRNQPTTINDREFSAHALDQMQNRGVTPSVVESAINSGGRFPTQPGTTGFYDAGNDLRVIMNSDTGRVVTVIR